MNDRTIVQHPNGYSGVLMGKSTMMIYDKDDNCIVHTCFRTPNTKKELYEVLETMPRFIEILASVEAEQTEPQTHDLRTDTHECVKDTHDKTENCSQIPNNCDTCRFELYCPEMCEGCCEWDSHYEPTDEQTDCAWK